MVKEYAFDKGVFNVKITITGIFIAIIFLLSIYGIFTTDFASLCAVVAVVSGYATWNTFVSISNPEKVTLGEDVIRFSAFGRIHEYPFCKVQQLRIREFPTAGKMFIRINHPNAIKGRYWVHTSKFVDGDELFRALLDLEYKMHPDSLKAKARTTNTIYNEKKKKIDQKKLDQKKLENNTTGKN